MKNSESYSNIPFETLSFSDFEFINEDDKKEFLIKKHVLQNMNQILIDSDCSSNPKKGNPIILFII